jgi:hypothetical protein
MTRDLIQEQDRAERRRLLRCRLLGLCLTILLCGAGWLWQLHHPDPGDSFPELRRSSGGEVRL